MKWDRRSLLFALAVASGFACAFPSTSNVESDSPNATQVDDCRKTMRLAPDLAIRPLGYKLARGIDPAIWFKFTTERRDIARLFQSDIDTSRFKPGIDMAYAFMPAWWDPRGRRLVGGHIALPNACYMTVGIDTQSEPMTVFIMWHAT